MYFIYFELNRKYQSFKTHSFILSNLESAIDARNLTYHFTFNSNSLNKIPNNQKLLKFNSIKYAEEYLELYVLMKNNIREENNIYNYYILTKDKYGLAMKLPQKHKPPPLTEIPYIKPKRNSIIYSEFYSKYGLSNF